MLIVFLISSAVSVTEMPDPGMDFDIFSLGSFSDVISGVWIAMNL